MAATASNNPDVDLAECTCLQQEEWDVLEAIFPDYLSGDISTGRIKFEIPTEFAEPKDVIVFEGPTSHAATEAFPHGVHARTSREPGPSRMSLTALPPLLLDIVLPSTYPYDPPAIVSLHATYSWLPLGRGIQRNLLEMWQKGDGVLYSWVEWLRNGQFLDVLGLTTAEGGIRISHLAPHVLVPTLKAYDQSIKLTRFSQTSYTCEICLTSIKGARCILLSCSHVFCRGCLEDFWKLCIAEGDVGRVGCPDPGCVKNGREADEEEVRRVVTEDEVRRWKWLREKRELEKDPTILHCPVQVCQRPVPKPRNVEEGSGWDRLRTCPDCGYSFCAHCKRTWHGPLSDCPLSTTESFVLEFLALPEGSPGRLLMERRYGATNIRKLVAKYEEQQANKQWLEESTTPCPSCHIHVEKSLGCNHMTCAKCKQHFCYRCGEKLLANDPYVHFSTPGHRCFSKLFDFQSIDDEWQPVEGFEML